MICRLLGVCALWMAGSATLAAQEKQPVDYVSTLVGTASSYELSAGNTYPATAMPWGMNCWTPQTGRNGDGWTYTYQAHQIRGFKQTHQPSPWINDYGQFSIFPESARAEFDQDKRASWFSHKTETALPYYYKVYLADEDVTVEMAPTERAAMFRLTYPEGDAFLVVDAFDSRSQVVADTRERRITGFTTKNSGGVPADFKNYFVIVLDRDFEVVQTHESGLVIGFHSRRGEQAHVRVASSFISPEQAVQNLRELGGGDFDTVCRQGRDRWNEVLGRVEIHDDDTSHKQTFYSCLYRSLLFPRSLYEVTAGGDTLHYSPYNGKVERGYMFTDTGFWDTFRSLFPLLNLLYPSMGVKMQDGLANAYRESGFLPEWASPGHRDCMVGNNSASVVADAWIKGVRSKDIATLWEAVVHGANHAHPQVGSTGRKGVEYYNRLGDVPCDVGINESVARTLEYAYDDWCIWQLGKALGKPDSEISVFGQRARNYRNVFDSGSRLMRGRRQDGSWQTPFNPLRWGGDFTEGNSWHYSWSVFHAPDDLARLMGGKEAFAVKLDSVFSLPPVYDASYYGQVIHEIREMQVAGMGNYAHGNQPAQHIVYLYDYVGQPRKTQYWVRETMDRLYSAAPDGYPGDEDNGQTSAWYVFSALGFYPVCPASDEYALGVPYFRQAVLHLENGQQVVIDARNLSPARRYVGELKVNGKSWTQNILRHGMLVKGARLVFEMTDDMGK